MGAMRVDSVMELYLTAYGWEIYSLLFFTFTIFGGVMYPFGRIIFDVFNDRVTGVGSPYNSVRVMLQRLLMAGLVFIVGVLPMAKYEAQHAIIQKRCVNLTPAEALSNDKVVEDVLSKRFGDVTRVPLIPYLAMTMAAGVNAVMYKNMPCGNDVVAMNNLANSLNIDKAKNVEQLKEEFIKFNQQCKRKADSMMTERLSGAASTSGRAAVMYALLDEYVKKRDPMAGTIPVYDGSMVGGIDVDAATKTTVEQYITNYAGSELYREVFYSNKRCQGAAPAQTIGRTVSATEFSAAWTDFCKVADIPIQSSTPIEGFNYNAGRDKEAGQFQAGAGNTGFPTCDEWWGNPQTGLRDRLGLASYQSAVDFQQKCTLFFFNCRNYEEISGTDNVIAENFDVEGKYYSLDEAKKDWLIARADQNSPMASGTGMSGGESASLAVAGIVGGALEIFTQGNFQGPMAKLTDFYAGAWIGKLMLKFLQPMMLMGIYALWLIYMVVSEFGGMALIRGMMMIFALKFVSGLWAWADYVDSVVFSMLFPGGAGHNALVGSTPDRLIIDIASTLFYFIVPMLLFMLISAAKGPDASKANQSIRDEANTIGNKAGGLAGSGVTKGIDVGGKGAKGAANKLK